MKDGEVIKINRDHMLRQKSPSRIYKCYRKKMHNND